MPRLYLPEITFIDTPYNSIDAEKKIVKNRGGYKKTF